MAQQDFSVAGNLRVIGSTVITGQVAIGGSSLNLATFATDMIANIRAANSNIASVSTAVNSAITSTNVSMKSYVDATISSAVIAAGSYGNTIVAAYLPINPTITSLQSNSVSLQSNSVTMQANIVAANLRIASLQSNITATNIVLGATDSNVSYLQGAVSYLTANVLSNGAVYASNVYAGTGNLTIGNINASGNLVMVGTDATTIRFVRSSDTTVTPGEVYGNIDFAGEDASSSASGVKARISTLSSGTVGQTEVLIYTSGDNGSFGQNMTQNFKVNASGYFGYASGFIRQEIPNLGAAGVPFADFEPRLNDGTQNNIINLTTSSVDKLYNSWDEIEIGQTFTMTYSGFAGGDRANVDLRAYHTQLGMYPLTTTDSGTTQVEISVMGTYIQDPTVSPPVLKRLRKRWIATIAYTSATQLFSLLDQQLCEAVYNSDATNWAAGAANAGKVFLQANATPGSTSVYLRFDAPTGAVSTSAVTWQWSMKMRTIEAYTVV